MIAIVYHSGLALSSSPSKIVSAQPKHTLEAAHSLITLEGSFQIKIVNKL
jgi:hypothetical protein